MSFPSLTRRTRDALLDVWRALPLEPQPAEAPPNTELAIWRAPGYQRLLLCTMRIGPVEVLHATMLPDPRFDLPVYGAEVVAGPGGPNLAVVDLAPLAPSAALETALLNLPPARFSDPRPLPEWGDVFSRHVICVKPHGPGEEQAFVARAAALAALAAEAPLCPGDGAAGLRRWLERHRENERTRRALERALGAAEGSRFLDEVLFPRRL
jgi:phycocyanobilin:ferredoxin oxidoreductase